MFVTPPEYLAISRDSSSVVMNFSGSIGQPSGWDESTQRIAIEIAITSQGRDDSTVFRGTGGCVVDISSSASSNTFGTTQTGAVTIASGYGSIFVLNDRTPQLSNNGEIDDVINSIQRVQIRCDSYDDLRNKYVRVGAVPTETGGTCGGANADTTCEALYYLFSTQRYYRAGCSNLNEASGQNHCSATSASNGSGSNQTAAISNLRGRAELLTIGVDGTNRTGGNRRGWVATLTTRDEILLTNSLGGARMIGTTDMNNTWSWNSNWGGSGSGCTTSEGTFRWLGPDSWCEPVPTQNYFTGNSTEYIGGDSSASGVQNGTASRYWIRNGSAWATTSQSTSAVIDFRSTTTPTTESWTGASNGFGFAHYWHTTSTGVVDEPNSSGDYIYMGYNSGSGEPGWDDAAPGGANDRDANGQARPINFYAEFCSPAQPCTPPDQAVASTEILPDQGFVLRRGTSKLVDAQNNWTQMPELSFGETLTANIVICIRESTTASSQVRFSLLRQDLINTSTRVSGDSVTSISDSIFQSSSDPGQTLVFEGARVAALRAYNGQGDAPSPLIGWIPQGTYFSGRERIWIRVIGRSESGRPLAVGICNQATTANSWLISLRPYVLQQTTRQGEVKTKQNE
jgi:hypothetical protein